MNSAFLRAVMKQQAPTLIAGIAQAVEAQEHELIEKLGEKEALALLAEVENMLRTISKESNGKLLKMLWRSTAFGIVNQFVK